VPLTYVLAQLEHPNWALDLLNLDAAYLGDVWERRGNLSAGEAQALWSLYVLNEKIKNWKKHLAN
jgi:hypothetical protein